MQLNWYGVHHTCKVQLLAPRFCLAPVPPARSRFRKIVTHRGSHRNDCPRVYISTKHGASVLRPSGFRKHWRCREFSRYFRRNPRSSTLRFVCVRCSQPGPEFTNDLKTILGLRTILWQLANSQNTYDNLKTYLKAKSHDHHLDVFRLLGSISQIGLLS